MLRYVTGKLRKILMQKNYNTDQYV